MAAKQRKAPGFPPKVARKISVGEGLKCKVIAAYYLDEREGFDFWRGYPDGNKTKVVHHDGHNYVAVRDNAGTLIALYRVRIDGKRFRRLSDHRDKDGVPTFWPEWAAKEIRER